MSGIFIPDKEVMNAIKFSAIYCDCPWKYEQKRLPGSAEKHYVTMGVDELCALPVAEIAADDCALFLWATFAMLPEALRVISAWKFRYKTVSFLWLKKNKRADSFFYGLGFWTRGNAEVCLLATKGHPKRRNKGISQLVISPVEAHSKKPAIVRDKIVELLGDVPRIELFARERATGWAALGNEIDGKDIRDALRAVIEA